MKADFALDYDILTIEQPQKLYLMARFESGDASAQRKRRPLNLSLVIDRSGSMAGDKIDYTKQAAQFLVQHLNAEDILSIVLYNDKIETLLEPQPIVNKDQVSQQLEKIRVRGTTNLSGGWLEGCMHVAANQSPDKLNRVLLMTDGLANRGITEPAQIISIAQQKREAGISTTTMGLGSDFNEDLLMDMSTAAGGAFYFIESPEVAPEIFHEELAGLLNIVGQNLSISIFPSHHITLIQQLNAYPAETDGKSTHYRLGDVYGNEVKTLLLELSIPALKQLGEIQIATLRFEWDRIDTDAAMRETIEVPVMVNVQQSERDAPSVNVEVAQQVLLLKAAQARRRAIEDADKGQYDKAARHLTEVADAIQASAVMNPSLSDEREALIKQATDLQRGDKYDAYSRKTMSSQAFYTMTDRHEDTMMLRVRENARAQEAATGEPPVESMLSPANNPQRMPGVTPTHIQYGDRLIELTADSYIVGRSVKNAIPVDSKGVSRKHCEIRREGGQIVVDDLQSTNGTYINGKRLDAPYRVSVGDVLQVDNQQMTFTLQDTENSSGIDEIPEPDDDTQKP